MMLIVHDPASGHRASCLFGPSIGGGPEDALRGFLKILRAGRVPEKAEKVSKSGAVALPPEPWRPLDCGGIDLGDDFTPFLGRRLRRTLRTPRREEYEVEPK